MKPYLSGLSGFELFVAIIAILLLALGLLAFQAWLLGIVLGWFGVALGFWKNVLIVLLISMLFGGSRSSK